MIRIKHFVIAGLVIILSHSATAADEPFEDLDAELAAPKTKEKSTSEAKPKSKSKESDSLEDITEEELNNLDEPAASVDSSEKSSDDLLSDDDLKSMEGVDGGKELEDSLADQADDQGVRDVLTPDKESAEAPEDELAELPEDEVPDLKEIKKAPEVVKMPEALKANTKESDDGSALDPSDQFARIPLRPAMSNENWDRYSGPAQKKDYRIRKGDTLWAISERLFGNPYLWPKVWNLNAQFTNPHIVEAGVYLDFVPGNANAGPQLAFRQQAGESTEIYFAETSVKATLMDEMDSLLKEQGREGAPLFKSLVVDNMPETVGRIPKRTDEARVFFSERDRFKISDVPNGEYTIIRKAASSNFSENLARSRGATRLLIIGLLSVADGWATVKSSYGEINEDDYLTLESFKVSSLAIREEKLGEAGQDVSFISTDEGTDTGVSAGRVTGLKLPSDSAVSPGSILYVTNDGVRVGSLLVLFKEGPYATAYVSESTREFNDKDRIE